MEPAGFVSLAANITPSAARDPSILTRYLPSIGGDLGKVAFFSGRPFEAGLRTALPVVLVSPAFGLLNMAGFDKGDIMPGAQHFRVSKASKAGYFFFVCENKISLKC